MGNKSTSTTDVPHRLIEGDMARQLIDLMSEYTKIQNIRAIQLSFPFMLDVGMQSDVKVSGTVKAAAGSYLALAPNGSLYPIPADVFESVYRKVERGEG